MSDKYATFSLKAQERNEIEKVIPHMEGLFCKKCQCVRSISSNSICPTCGERMEEKVILNYSDLADGIMVRKI